MGVIDLGAHRHLWLAGENGLAQRHDRSNRPRQLGLVPFTPLSNLTGTPAMSVPHYSTPDGLPMGVQFIAKFGCEDRLLQLANQLQTARDWSQKLPAWVML